MMDNVFPLRFRAAAGGLEADAPPSEFLFSVRLILMQLWAFDVKQFNLPDGLN